MAIYQEERVSPWWTHSVGRRTLLRGGLLGGVGLAAAALIGCTGDDDDHDGTTADSTKTVTVSPTPAQAPTLQPTPTGDNCADCGVNWREPIDDDEPDTEAEEYEALGELVQDPALPYPYNFPEPNKTPQPGGIMKVAATWNFQSLDPVDSAAGGTVTVPNMVYNRLIGFKRGPVRGRVPARDRARTGRLVGALTGRPDVHVPDPGQRDVAERGAAERAQVHGRRTRATHSTATRPRASTSPTTPTSPTSRRSTT